MATKIKPIEICTEVVNCGHPEPRLAVLRQKFQSRNADFVVQTGTYVGANYAVSLRVGPIGLDIRADEAEVLGKALIAAAKHYVAAVAEMGV